MQPKPPQPQIIGKWQNTAVPYKHRMHIAYSQPFYAVSFDLQTASCGGAVDGLATYDEAQKTLILQSPAADDEEEKAQILEFHGEVCNIRIQLQDQQAIVTENGACLYYHGVGCNFEGRLEKMPVHLRIQSAAAKIIGL